ncbi:MAG: DUF4402 domain-containing protein [Bacteroidales bacterium]|nr:DUF4402 domain-containing protein [Bacteroidales bacterium]
MTRILTAVVFTLLFNGQVWAQASVTTQAYAEIIAALTATENAQLNFGRFYPGLTGGEVIISPDGVKSALGSVMLSGGNSSPGRFTITGAPDATFSIQLPEGPVQLLHQGSSQTMIVNEWTSDPPAGYSSGTLNEGSEIVSVGASLVVGSIENNPVGIYTGSFNLTFAYN